MKNGIEDSLKNNNIQFTIEQTLILNSLIEDSSHSTTLNKEKIYQKLGR